MCSVNTQSSLYCLSRGFPHHPLIWPQLPHLWNGDICFFKITMRVKKSNCKALGTTTIINEVFNKWWQFISHLTYICQVPLKPSSLLSYWSPCLFTSFLTLTCFWLCVSSACKIQPTLYSFSLVQRPIKHQTHVELSEFTGMSVSTLTNSLCTS